MLLIARRVFSCAYAAAAREETEGRGPLLQLLESTPPPGALEWPPAMALALALGGKWSRELEFDVALRVIRDEDSIIIIQESKLRATGAVLAGARRACAVGHAPPARLPPHPRLQEGGSAACPARGWLLMAAAVLGKAESPCSSRLAALHRCCPPPPPGGAGISKALRQLRQAFRLVAWLHFALGAALPRLEGRIVVPGSELRAAQRKLRGASGTVQDSVPGEAGAKFTMSVKADTA